MAYLGVPQSKLENLTTNVQIVNLSASFDGTTVTFNLQDSRGNAVYAVADRALLVILGGITQKPGVDYTTSGTTITFTTAPVSNLTIEIRKFYGVQRIIGVNDGVITPIKLSAGGPSWNSSGNVTISGDLNVTGAFNAGGNGLFWEDNEKANFGSNNDLQIYHNGVNSFIRDAGTGSLFIEGTDLTLRAADSTTRYLVANETNGDVSLFYGNNVKLATKTDGVNITGELECDSLDVDGAANIQSVLTMQSYIQGTTTLDLYGDSSASQGLSLDASGNVTLQANLDLQDNDKILLGTSNDLDIYHDGTDSYLRNQTGQLLIRSDDIKLNNYLGTKTHAEFIDGGLKTGSIDLFDVSSSISDTATDVFVYDTSKDFDGGAWRKRTQNTSWYNETLNTATRGSRKEFPAVAVLVLEGAKLTIYDGDDPDLPMWMKFEVSGNAWNDGVLPAFNAYRAISALNGTICVASTNNSYGLIKIQFISDDAYSHTTSTNYGGHDDLGLSQRNSSGHTFLAGSGTAPLGVIVNNYLNDVAMTVLPNAPIDDTTGLPTPTIAVATDGGVSVIKDDGTVVDSAFTTSVNYLSFSEDGNRLFVSRNDSRVFTSSITSSISADGWGNDNEYFRKDASNTTNFPWINEDSSGSATSRKNEKNVYGSQFGLTIIDETPGVVGTGMGAWISSSYNTGYMHGDIKGAFLSDTDTTNVTGSELVSNYDFTSGTTNWTTSLNGGFGGASVTASSNQLVFTQGTNSVWLEAYQDITTVSGEKYVVDFEIASSNTNANWRIIVAGTIVIGYPTLLGQGHHSYTFTASSTTTRVSIQQGGSAGVSGTAESLSVRIAELDRSVNNNGLQVFGTITKTAVATGADLVAYSGFSDSNYLYQPPNSDMAFGTGDFSYIYWFKSGTAAAERIYITFDNWVGSSRTGSIIHLRYNANGRLTNYFSDDGFSTFDTLNGGRAINDNNWHCVVSGRRGNRWVLYIDGELDLSIPIANAAATMTNPTAYTMIGKVGSAGGYGFSEGSLSLVRVSLSIPSPEQIKKIYNDEKWLFQENAACTLYGSSDAVTALAHDEFTNILHVGTSAGRSDFRGLRRINNTTTAVTTAISAQDDLIAQQ